MSPEVSAFYARFSETLRHADTVLDENYVGAPQAPVIIPPVDSDEVYTPRTEPVPASVKVQLKSVRSPKFSVEYEISPQSSVFALKERLLTDPDHPVPEASEFHHPAAIKLLLKSKVVTDTKQLRELPSLSFTVMLVHAEEQLRVPLAAPLYWSKDIANIAASTSQNAGAVPAATKNAREYPGITDQFWTDIANVAKKYVPNPAEIVGQLRSSYEVSADLD